MQKNLGLCCGIDLGKELSRTVLRARSVSLILVRTLLFSTLALSGYAAGKDGPPASKHTGVGPDAISRSSIKSADEALGHREEKMLDIDVRSSDRTKYLERPESANPGTIVDIEDLVRRVGPKPQPEPKSHPDVNTGAVWRAGDGIEQVVAQQTLRILNLEKRIAALEKQIANLAKPASFPRTDDVKRP